MAIVIPADIAATAWSHPSGATGHFRPNGRPQVVTIDEDAARPNPSTWQATGPQTMAARLFVGFNVGDKPTWKMQHLIDVVRRVRSKQRQREDASFVAQKGIYTHQHEGRRKPHVIEEEGAQVVLIRMPPETERAFRKHAIELAERIAGTMEQAEVVLEIQRGGLVQEVMGVAP